MIQSIKAFYGVFGSLEGEESRGGGGEGEGRVMVTPLLGCFKN